MEVPPVPIPNTEVKLHSADDTWRATAWESRSSPDILTEAADIVKYLLHWCILAKFVKQRYMH